MKLIGGILILAGICFIAFIIFRLTTETNDILSPIPEDSGIKVIYITPEKK